MQPPDPLSDHRGNGLATPDLVFNQGASILGTKALLLTDTPALHLHDTGGLLGKDQVLTAEPFGSDDEHLFLTAQSHRAVGVCKFPRGPRIGFALNGEADRVVTTLFPHNYGAGTFDSGIPMSVRCAFEAQREEILDPLVEKHPGLSTHGGDALEIYERSKALPAVARAVYSNMLVDEFSARVLVRGKRLQLRWQDQVLADLPLTHLRVEQPGPRQINITTTTVVCGHSVSGTTLWFWNESAATHFLAACGATDTSRLSSAKNSTAVTSGVELTGCGANGASIHGHYDVLLAETTLEFLGAEGALLHGFDLTAPTLRIAGTSESFLIQDKAFGPVQIAIANERFQRRVHDHPLVKSCAQRSLTESPFPVHIDGRPISLAVTPEGLVLRGADRADRVAIQTIENASYHPATGVLTVKATGQPLELVGEMQLLRGIHTAVHSELLRQRQDRKSAAMPSAVLGREGDYLLYSIFGQFYEVHAELCRQWGRPGELHAVTLPTTTQSQLELASVLAQSMEQILRHLDMVANYLPSFLVTCDASAFPQITGTALRKRHESSYRSILAATRGLSGELAVVRESLLRIEGVRSAPEASYSLATISLAAASFVSPVFVVSGVQQAFSTYRHNQQSQVRLGEVATEAVRRGLEKWNYWMETLLPAFSHHLVDGLFAMRSELAQKVSAALDADSGPDRDAIFTATIQRLATLETYLLYPVDPTSRHPRGDMVRAIRAARERLTYPGFEAI